jgi:hypothetical protein
MMHVRLNRDGYTRLRRAVKVVLDPEQELWVIRDDFVMAGYLVAEIKEAEGLGSRKVVVWERILERGGRIFCLEEPQIHDIASSLGLAPQRLHTYLLPSQSTGQDNGGDQEYTEKSVHTTHVEYEGT